MSSSAATVNLSVEAELSAYKMLRTSDTTTPLQYWRQQSKDYPIMSAVARRVFVVSASSAQSERDFSAVGRTITDARSQLSASKVEAVEMLRWGMKAGLV